MQPIARQAMSLEIINKMDNAGVIAVLVIDELKHLSNMATPYQYLNLKFIPLGGLSIENAGNYVKSTLITAIGGSWIAKRPMIQAEDWEGITNYARQIKSLIR